MKTKDEPMVHVRMPASLIRQLDKAAKQEQRTRSAEMRHRLVGSFAKSEKQRAA